MGGGTTRDILGKEGEKFTKKVAGGFGAGSTGGAGRGFGSSIEDVEEQKRLATAPGRNALNEEAIRAAIIARMRQDLRRGGGRGDTIATSAAGVTNRAPVKKKRLIGA